MAYIDTRIRHGVYGYSLSTPEGQTMRNLRDPLSYSAWCKGILFRIPHVVLLGEMDQAAYQRALHTIVHVLLHAALPYIGGQIQEIGGLVMFPYGYLLLFDQPTGSGVCAMLLPHLSTVFQRAADILTCTCKNPNGCPRCTFLPRCSSRNDNLDKFGAQAILRQILDQTLEFSLGDYYDHHTQVVQ
ncbi:MAG: Zn-binding domain-containing protein [Candidatus Heimdallarchaeota archaeon]